MDIPAKWGQSSEPAPKACDILECTVAHGKTSGFQDPCIVLGLGCGSPPDLKNLDPSLPQPLREARCIRCSRLPHQEENIAPMCYPLFTLVLSSFRRSFPSFLRCGRCLCRTFFICRLTGTGGGPALPPPAVSGQAQAQIQAEGTAYHQAALLGLLNTLPTGNGVPISPI